MSLIQCNVIEISDLTDSVKRIIVKPDVELDFSAGQYIRVVLQDSDRRPFSIANAPDADGTIELHIGAAENNPYAMQAVEYLQANSQANIDGPHGNAYVRQERPHPTILLAGGTGFSYTYSILQELLKKDLKEPLFLYWGTRTLGDMYAYDELKKLAEQHKHFHFMPVVENPPADWQGKTGWVHQAILNDFVSLEPYRVYVAGRFEMAGVVREEFTQKGLLKANLFGDAYDFI